MFPGFGYKQPFPQAMSPHMKMGASNSPFTYETWPHHHGYSVPTQCHSCCNQNTYPNYYPYVPHPYTHLPPPPPPPVHPQFYYPVYPESYPFHYAPPHHYTMELPKYEYDKTVPHCHGCNNHSKGQGVKIEEQESEAQKPIVWVPSDYMKNQERLSDSTKSRGDGERHSNLSGWMPLDMDNLKRLLQNGKLSKEEDDQPKNQVKQMPFPMVWLPYKNEERDGENLSVEKRDKPSKTIAVKHEDDQPKNEVHQIPFPMFFIPCNNDEKGQKSIPADKTGEKTSVEKRDKPVRTIHVQPMDEIDGTQSGNGLKAKSKEKDAKGKPSSPTNASKLPPVCLRIDPLPKKKNGEGKSRSPSPPRDKVQQVEVVKPSSSSSSSSAAEKDAVEVSKPSRLAGNDSEAKQEAQEVKEKKSEKKMVSGEEAATIIQSVYRGYEVRRWEPLKKMKQIAKIQEEAAALKKCIEGGVDSMDLKQKTALGENIMSLLLKLDTIQGLHSSMRDIRKSVARELVSLQEMLDTIVIKQPEGESKVEDGSRNEDHCEVEIEEITEDKSLHEELNPCKVIHEQQAPEPKEVTAMSAAEEVESHLSDSASEQNKVDEVGDSAIQNEGHVDSADQIDDLHVSMMDEEDVNASKEESGDAAIDSEKQHDSVEGSAATTEQVNVDAAEEEVICSTGNNKAKEDETQVHEEFDSSVTEPLKVEAPLNDEAEDAEEVKMELSENNTTKEDETQVQEGSDTSVTEPVEGETEEVKMAICSTENKGDKEDEGKRRAMEDTEKMREYLEKMIESGKEQQQVVYNLNQKIKELEGKLAKQKEMNKKKKKKKARVFLRRGPLKSPVAKQP